MHVRRGVHPVIQADGGDKPVISATLNGHGPHGATNGHEQKGSLPTVSPGKLHYSKAARAAAFAECRAIVSEHDSCAFIDDPTQTVHAYKSCMSHIASMHVAACVPYTQSINLCGINAQSGLPLNSTKALL